VCDCIAFTLSAKQPTSSETRPSDSTFRRHADFDCDASWQQVSHFLQNASCILCRIQTPGSQWSTTTNHVRFQIIAPDATAAVPTARRSRLRTHLCSCSAPAPIPDGVALGITLRRAVTAPEFAYRAFGPSSVTVLREPSNIVLRLERLSLVLLCVSAMDVIRIPRLGNVCYATGILAG
jgi:hypothetical protein